MKTSTVGQRSTICGTGQTKESGSIPGEHPDVPTLTMMTPKVTQWTPLTQEQTYPQVKDLATPPLIFTDPKIAEKLTISDTGDSETEGPQVDFIGEYCRMYNQVAQMHL